MIESLLTLFLATIKPVEEPKPLPTPSPIVSVAPAPTPAPVAPRKPAKQAIFNSGAPNAVLARVKACESGGNYRAINPTGKYRGAYQFDMKTWAGYGPAGDPAAASPAEQDRRALLLYQARGTAPWPNYPWPGKACKS